MHGLVMDMQQQHKMVLLLVEGELAAFFKLVGAISSGKRQSVEDWWFEAMAWANGVIAVVAKGVVEVREEENPRKRERESERDPWVVCFSCKKEV